MNLPEIATASDKQLHKALVWLQFHHRTSTNRVMAGDVAGIDDDVVPWWREAHVELHRRRSRRLLANAAGPPRTT